MKKRVKVKFIDYGIGYCCDNGSERYIEINRNLRNYPKLYRSVLNHELKHFNSSNKHLDFWTDFKEIFSFGGWDMLKFQLSHPKSLLSLSPFLHDKKGWSANWFMVIFNSLIISLVIGGFLILA